MSRSHHSSPRPRSLLIALVALGLLLSSAGASNAAPTNAPGRASSTHATTAEVEAARVDRVKAPVLRWAQCSPPYDSGEFQCSTVNLPLDYDRPRGAQVKVALLRVPARDPGRRIGSLFLNPGGPGGSGKSVAARATGFLSPTVVDRFDLIGMDPRGTNDSTRVQCYPNARLQARDTSRLAMAFPTTPKEDSEYRSAAAHLALMCSHRGRPLSAAMSTAEVARDMEVLRRAVGDKKLTFLGWSYGTYLGQVYAGLFPDRFRALAMDGVVDGRAWQGDVTTSSVPSSIRMNPAAGTDRVVRELLDRCASAGASSCPLMPDPKVRFDEVLNRLEQQPLVLTDENGATETLTYALLVHALVLTLYDPNLTAEVPNIVAAVDAMSSPTVPTATRQSALATYQRISKRVEASQRGKNQRAPLDNAYELAASVSCSDSMNPPDTTRWSELAAQENSRAPHFGRFWLWQSAWCASSAWTARDEDGYRGDFATRTEQPILVVGNYWDPATNYDGAVAVSRRLPNSRLLSSDSWGHTAYGTSSCVTSAMDGYLLNGVLPPEGTVCTGDIQPFS